MTQSSLSEGLGRSTSSGQVRPHNMDRKAHFGGQKIFRQKNNFSQNFFHLNCFRGNDFATKKILDHKNFP